MLLAKQATAKPETRPRPWQCGAHAATILDVSVKGTKCDLALLGSGRERVNGVHVCSQNLRIMPREPAAAMACVSCPSTGDPSCPPPTAQPPTHRRAPVKVYTDALLQGSGLQILHGPGMEPALAMMALAGKRLAPSDPDKSLPRPPPIPWWDDLRYMWRGRAGLEVAGLRLTLAADRRAGPGPDSARLVLAAHRVGAELAEGVAELRLAGLAVDAFEAVGLDGPAGGLLRLPMLAVPALTLRLEAGWRLPGGRTPRQHHLFPPTPPLDGVQGPRLPGELYKSEALDLGITADLGGSAAQSAVVYLGDHQVGCFGGRGMIFYGRLGGGGCKHRCIHFHQGVRNAHQIPWYKPGGVHYASWGPRRNSGVAACPCWTNPRPQTTEGQWATDAPASPSPTPLPTLRSSS